MAGAGPRTLASDEWIVEIRMALGCLNDHEVKTGSICRVPEKIREPEAKGFSYRPQLVAMGPFHRGTRSDLQIAEGTKWQFMHYLLRRPTQNVLLLETVNSCCEAIKGIGDLIRASYGEKIEMGAEELARIMLLDGCFLLEFLLRLTKDDEPVSEKNMLQILTDLTMLENQIPFVVLTTLSSTLFQLQGAAQQPKLACLYALSLQVGDKVQLSPENIAESLFQCNDPSAADFSEKGAYHFLHLIHSCSPDPYREEKQGKEPLQLQRCARKLQAFGITITAASQTNDSNGNDKRGTVASLLNEFADKFKFKIEFDERRRELIIPTLHIKESTEVKWRNLIALEQIGLSGISYKFTSYGYFFKGLVCSVHDLKLLKEKGVISVHKEVIKGDEDLVKMFQNITTGAEQRDSRYRKVCKRLNKAKVNGCCVILKMPEHYLWRFLEWLRRRLVTIWLRNIIHMYLGTPWKILGIVSGTTLLVLTIMQVVYAARGQ